LVSLGTRRDEKDAPINAPSFHIGALVGADSLWPILSTKNFQKWTRNEKFPHPPSKGGQALKKKKKTSQNITKLLLKHPKNSLYVVLLLL
jgi:hypothetical protein